MAMNTHMKAVQLSVKGKPTMKLESMSIRGSNVRCASSNFAPICACEPALSAKESVIECLI